jgi:hypothetical protein
VTPSPTPDPEPSQTASDDPILVRRAKWNALAKVGCRVGYVLYAIAMVAFFIGFFGDFTTPVIVIVEIGLVAGSLILAPAMLLLYMVKAAVRDDADPGRQS